MTLTSIRRDFFTPHRWHHYSFLMIRIFIALIFFSCTGVHAQSTMYERMKQVISVQEKATNLASSLVIVTNVFNDLSAIDGNTISNLKAAIIERQKCLNIGRNEGVMPIYGGIKCPTEPRTLGLLNTQLVRAIQMQKLGSIRLTRDVLCLASESVRVGSLPANLLPKLSPIEQEAWNSFQRGFKDAYGAFSSRAKDAISQKCDLSLKRSDEAGDEFKSALGFLAENAWIHDSINEINKSCSRVGYVTDTEPAAILRTALSYCYAIDKEGAQTEEQAQAAIDSIKAQLLADEQTTIVPPPAITYSNQPSSVWNGAYTCLQGITQLQLRSYNSTVANASPLFIFSFGPHPNNPNVPSGEFSMLAKYTVQPGGNFNARPLSWIRQPSGYFMVGLDGKFSPDISQIFGTVSGEGCTTFRLQRIK